ncbi:MAG: hypothetical protein IH840_04065 [Candidatus Heimdallarchaeota archaeon]|nr:hypothetical protein [Candidatus Heimdallarchaeota archaeon]
MITISLLTWRLGNITSEEFECLLLETELIKTSVEEIANLYSGVFYLSTCQRVIIAVSSTDADKLQTLAAHHLENLGLNDQEFPRPEILLQSKALYHLGEVISGLDSVVIGEDQIQSQFKSAYQMSEPYMNKNLKTILQLIIRTGKRVRNSTLNQGNLSTISLLTDLITDEIESAGSIGIIGTGKISYLIIKHLTAQFDNLSIQVYSTQKDRVKENVLGLPIYAIENLQKHDIIFAATSTTHLINPRFIQHYHLVHNFILVDFGMPRNCHPEVSALNNITLYNLLDLIKISKLQKTNKSLSHTYNVLNMEIELIIQNFDKQQLTEKHIKSLRFEIERLVQKNKASIVNGEAKNSKSFDQFVNQLIHISQQHLERAITEGR